MARLRWATLRALMMSGSRVKSSPTTLRVKYKAGSVSDFVKLAAQDISDAGMFIRTRKPLAVGAQVKLQLVLEDGSTALSGLGHIAFSRTVFAEAPMGMGVSFDSLDQVSRETVRAAVAIRGARGCRFDDRTDANLPEDMLPEGRSSLKPAITGAFSGAPKAVASPISGPVAGAFSAGAFSAAGSPVPSRVGALPPPPAAVPAMRPPAAVPAMPQPAVLPVARPAARGPVVQTPAPSASAPGPTVEHSRLEPSVPGLFANSSTASDSSFPPAYDASGADHSGSLSGSSQGAKSSFFPPAEASSFFAADDGDEPASADAPLTVGGATAADEVAVEEPFVDEVLVEDVSVDLQTPDGSLEATQVHTRDVGEALAVALSGPDVSPATAEAAREVGQLAEVESHGLGELFDDVFEEADSDLLEDCAPSAVPGELSPVSNEWSGPEGALPGHPSPEQAGVGQAPDSVPFPGIGGPLDDDAGVEVEFGEATSVFPRASGEEFALEGAEADVLVQDGDAPQLQLTESELDTSRHEAVAAALQAAPRSGRRRHLWVGTLSVIGFLIAFMVMSGRIPAPLERLVATLSGATDGDSTPTGPVQMQVVVTTDPRGARLAIDGVAQGEAPLRTQVVSGEPVKITASYPGYEILQKTWTAAEGQNSVRLSLVPRAFFVKVATRPSGAKVEALGKTCISPCELPLGFVDGVVSVSIRKKNYRRTSRPVRPEQFVDRKGRLEAGILVELSELPKTR